MLTIDIKKINTGSEKLRHKTHNHNTLNWSTVVIPLLQKHDRHKHKLADQIHISKNQVMIYLQNVDSKIRACL